MVITFTVGCLLSWAGSHAPTAGPLTHRDRFYLEAAPVPRLSVKRGTMRRHPSKAGMCLSTLQT